MEQEYFLAMLLGSYQVVTDQWLYIGAIFQGRDWVWDNHERITYPIAWLENQPDNLGLELCFSVFKSSKSGVGFNDIGCHYDIGFFCQSVGV